MKTYVFDIDGTILDTIIENGSYVVKGHNQKVLEKIIELYNNHNMIILHTGRHWNHLKDTVSQLNSIGIKYHSLVMGKPVADFYIDDKGIRPDELYKL